MTNRWGILVMAAWAGTALAAGEPVAADYASPRSMMVELRFGSYYPLIDREAGLSGAPWKTTFGSGMLLAELGLEGQLFQAFGTLALGGSAGYGEKLSHSTTASTGLPTSETLVFHIAPFRALASYRFDWLAARYGVPLVPYVKGALILASWWVNKGTKLDTSLGATGQGYKLGYGGTAGLALQLDFLERRLARDFDSSAGVNHSYIFGEYNLQEVNNFGAPGLDLSSRHFMFGLALEI